jgi:hypothetical protein
MLIMRGIVLLNASKITISFRLSDKNRGRCRVNDCFYIFAAEISQDRATAKLKGRSGRNDYNPAPNDLAGMHAPERISIPVILAPHNKVLSGKDIKIVPVPRHRRSCQSSYSWHSYG